MEHRRHIDDGSVMDVCRGVTTHRIASRTVGKLLHRSTLRGTLVDCAFSEI
jgi:hypothetical protein